MDVVIVRRGGNPDHDSIFEYVNAVYSCDIRTISKYTNIDNNREIRKELGDVMTAGQSLVAKGEAKGRAEGRAEGEAKGRAEGMVEGGNAKLYELVQNGLLSVSDAAKNMGVSEDAFVAKMRGCGYNLPK